MFEKKIIKADYNSAPAKLSLKKIFMTMILLAVLFLIAGLIVYFRPTFNKKEGVIMENKDNILNRLELYEKEGKPLNSEEKKEIFETLSDTKIQEYNFSKEEKIKLLKALNN